MIRRASKNAATPANEAAKVMPIGWNPSGTCIYFSEGTITPDGKRGCVTIEANLASGKDRQLSEWGFCDIAPDGTYILTHGPSGEGWSTHIVDLKTLHVRTLPATGSFFRLSLNGKIAACLYEQDKIACVRTDTWEIEGMPLPRPERLLELKDWIQDFRWVALPRSSSRPSTRGE